MLGIGRAARPGTAGRIADAALRAEIAAAVAALEDIQVADLTRPLARARLT